MTLQSLNADIEWPLWWGSIGTLALASLGTLDAAGEYIAFIYCARQDMTISHVGWRTSTVAGAPTVDTRIETVAADGTPSGTLWATNTNIVSGALSSNTFTLHALTASASITKGQMFCVKILYQSGTSVQVTHVQGMHANIYNVPYFVTNTSGSAVKARNAGDILLALGSSTTSFYALPATIPATTVTASNFNNTNAAKRGLRFQVPFKCRCVGGAIFNSSQVGDYNLILMNDAGTELSSSSTAFIGAHGAASGAAMLRVYFDNPVTLTPSTWYRLVNEPSSATNTAFSFFTLPSADYRSGTAFGTNAHYTTFASSAWDDTGTDKIPVISALVDQFDDGKSPRANYILGI